MDKDFNKTPSTKDPSLRSKITKQMRLSNLVNKTSQQIGDFASNLADALVKEYGLEGAQAEEAAKKIIGFINRNVNEKKAKALEKWILANKDRDGMKPLVLNVDRLKRLAAIGAFSDVNALNIIAQSLKLPHVKIDVMQNIEKLSENLQNAPAGIPTFIANRKLLTYLKQQEKVGLGRVTWGQLITNALFGFRTMLVNITSGGLNLAANTFYSNLTNAIRYKDATLIYKPLLNLFNNLGSVQSAISNAIHERGGAIAEEYEKSIQLHNLALNSKLQVGFFGYTLPPKLFIGLGYLQYITSQSLQIPDAIAKQLGFLSASFWEKYAKAELDVRKSGKEMSREAMTESLKQFEFETEDINLFTQQATNEFEAGQLSYNGEHEPTHKKWYGKKDKFNRYKAAAIKSRVEDLKVINTPLEITAPAHVWATLTAFQQEPRGILGQIYHLMNSRIKDSETGKKYSDYMIVEYMFLFSRVAFNVVNTAIQATPILNAMHIMNLMFPNTSFYDKKFYQEFDMETKQGLTPSMRSAMLGRAMFTYVMSAVVMMLLKVSYSLVDDDEEPWFDIYGSLQKLPSNKIAILKDKQYTVKIGDTSIIYKDMPFSLALGMIGNFLDEMKYDRLDDMNKVKSVSQMFLSSMLKTAVQIRDIGPLVSLRQMLGGSTGYNTEVSDDFQKSVFKIMGNLLSMSLPQELRNQYSIWIDDQLYSSEVAWKNMFRSIPMVNKAVGLKPIIGMDGEPIKAPKTPMGRLLPKDKDDPYFDLLYRMARKGLFIKDQSKLDKNLDETVRYNYKKIFLQTVKKLMIEEDAFNQFNTLPPEEFEKLFNIIQGIADNEAQKATGLRLEKMELKTEKQKNLSESKVMF